jgi:hypothetical protein
VSVVRGLRLYFLRVYAAESLKTNRSNSWGPFGEAMFQTVLLASMPIAGLGGAVIVLLPRSLDHVLTAYRSVITGGGAVASLVAVYLLVRHIAGDPKSLPASTSAYGTERDRVMIHIQFWCVLVGSLALPWLAAGVRKLSD